MPEDRRRVQERGERVEHLRVVRLARHLHDGPERRQRHLAQRFAVQRKGAKLRIRVVEIANDEGIVDDLRAFDHVWRLRDQLLPPARFRMCEVHGDDAAAWRAVVALKIENRTRVPHEPVRRIEVVQQPYDRRIEPGTLRIAEILVVDAIAPVGAEPNGVDGVAAVGADFDGEPPVGMIRPLIDQPVSRLIGPELVIIDFLVVVDLEQRVAARGGFRVATVKETGAVMRPRGARELDPFQVIAQVLPGCHVAHAEFLPIGAAA